MPFNVINLTYNWASDQVADEATITIAAGAAMVGYPPTNLTDWNPSKPARLTGNFGAFLFTFPAPTRIDLVAILNHNLDAGLTVQLLGNDTNSWSAPALLAPVVIPPWREDRYSVQPFQNLTTVAGYSPSGFKYWLLNFPVANSSPLAIGEVWLGRAIRTLDPNIEWNEEQEEERKIIEHTTDYGVTTVYDLGVTQWRLKGHLSNTPDVQRNALRSWWRDSQGRAKPFLLIPNGLENDARFVRWSTSKLLATYDFLDQTSFDLEWLEVGRGLYL